MLIDQYRFSVVFLNNRMYSLLMENELLTPHNSGFQAGDGTVCQLLSLTYKLSETLDDGKERGGFRPGSNCSRTMSAFLVDQLTGFQRNKIGG